MAGAENEVLSTLKGELGKFGEVLAENAKKSEERAKELDARLKALETTGTGGTVKTNYARALADGTPEQMKADESPEAFIERMRETEGVRYVDIIGQRVPILSKLPRGLASVRDSRGITGMRAVRAMALAVSKGKGFSHDDAIDAARTTWGAADPVLGILEETRDLIRALKGSDPAKRAEAERSLGTAVIGSGASLIGPAQAGPFIDFLAAIAVVRGLGVQLMPMSATAITMPFFDSGASVSYRGEQAGPNESSPGDGQLELLRKMLGGAIAISNELLAESSWAVDVLLRNHLARVMAAKADQKMILGRGTQHEIRGMDWWAEQPTTAHFGNRTLAGGVPTFKTILKDLTTAFQVIAAENKPIGAAEGATPFILTGNREHFGLMRVTNAYDQLPFYNEVRAGTLLGAKYAASTQIPENGVGDGAGSGTNNKSKVFVGDAGSLVIAESETFETQAFPGGAYKDVNGTMQSGVTNRETVITADQKHDFADLYRGKSLYRIDSVDWGNQF